jgi:hypothetical protein
MNYGFLGLPGNKYDLDSPKAEAVVKNCAKNLSVLQISLMVDDVCSETWAKV